MLKKKIKKSSKLLRQKLYLRKKLLEVYDQLLHTTYYKDLQNLEIEKKEKKAKKNKIAKQNRNEKNLQNMRFSAICPYHMQHRTYYMLLLQKERCNK